MFKVQETKRTKQFELINEAGEVAQKVCKTCQQVKLAEDFQKHNKGHLRPSCRSCFKEIQADYIKSIPSKRRAYKQAERAREVGAPDNYSEQDWKELNEHAQGRCMISNEKVELQAEHVQAISKQWLGSTKGNVILTSEKVNQAKRTMSLFEFIMSEKSKGLIDIDKLKETIKYLAKANQMEPAQYIQFLNDCEELAQKNKEYWN